MPQAEARYGIRQRGRSSRQLRWEHLRGIEGGVPRAVDTEVIAAPRVGGAEWRGIELVSPVRIKEASRVSDVYEDGPVMERPDPYESPDVADAASSDSEVDFDDETDDDQAPLDVVEAIETGTLLDDPEILSDTDDEI